MPPPAPATASSPPAYKPVYTPPASQPPAAAAPKVPAAHTAPAQAKAAQAVPPPAPVAKADTPKLHVPSSGGTPSPAAKTQPASDGDDTIVISSATQVPATKQREFIPASLSDAAPAPAPMNGLGALISQPMTAMEKNIAQRFEVLKRLLDEGLITPEEYARHRNANIGALLPFTHDPAAIGLERPSAGADAVVARLEALRRALEARAITPDQHASERAMILAALLPTTPDERAEPMPPPGDVIEGAAMVSHLQILKGRGLISTDEFDDERHAVDQYLRTGSFKMKSVAEAKEAKDSKDGKGSAKKDDAEAAKTASASAGDSEPSSEITGPVLHLASFRTEDAAKRAWQEALAQNKAILSSYHEIIRKIDLGQGKGIFFRLMAGPFHSVADAESTCIKLKANNQFCRASADGS